MRSFGDEDLVGSRILVVDDQEASVRLIEFLLEAAGFRQYASITDPRRILDLYATFRPDIILLDLEMPHLDGLAVIELLMNQFPPDSYLPILVLTGDVSAESRRNALRAGANDFLSKPFDRDELVLRVRNLLKTRWLHSQLRTNNRILEQKVSERTRQLAEAQLETLQRLAVAAEYRDDETGRHTERVGALAATIARTMGQPEDFVEVLRLAAPLHDVGKIGIPDRILLKPGHLTPEEFEIVKRHTVIGAEILGEGSYPVLEMAREIALSHHEKWDGSGYPLGLKGAEIPVTGKIVALADVFDALTHDRPYKRAWKREAALAEIQRLAGRHFDPDLVHLFLQVADKRDLQNLATAIDYPAAGNAYLISGPMCTSPE
ncbi:MAG TPA: HD domain-containing phosphohydrolase [Bryobacteraceae bacterium]|jgi:putative two-component system response regulator|nr:HD domain-containing phosphohydrolase [Bryobacteraceae bacterium]